MRLVALAPLAVAALMCFVFGDIAQGQTGCSACGSGTCTSCAASGGGLLSACSNCGGAGCSSCPTVPYPEGDMGTSLYWHNPCLCTSHPCGLPNCPTTQLPTWYGGSEVMALFRDASTDARFQTNGATGRTVLSESRFRSEFEAGTRTTLGRAIGDWYRLEGSYVGSFSWSDDLAVRNLDANAQAGSAGGNLMSPFSDFGNPAVAGLDFNNFASIRFASDFESVELNLRRRVRLPIPNQTFMDRSGRPLFLENRAETSFLVGLRYVSFEEQFGYATQSDVPAGGSNNQVDVSADNHMFGAQIGMLSQFMAYAQKGWIDFEVKGGIYRNDIQVNSSYVNTNTAGATLASFADSDIREKTSFIGELSLMYNHQVANSLTFRVGYNAFWLADVALGAENMSNDINLLSLGPAQARHDGDVVMHGPSLGLTWSR